MQNRLKPLTHHFAEPYRIPAAAVIIGSLLLTIITLASIFSR